MPRLPAAILQALGRSGGQPAVDKLPAQVQEALQLVLRDRPDAIEGISRIDMTPSSDPWIKEFRKGSYFAEDHPEGPSVWMNPEYYKGPPPMQPIIETLGHELKHHQQYQPDWDRPETWGPEGPRLQAKAYAKANKEVGYQRNPFEIDARVEGRALAARNPGGGQETFDIDFMSDLARLKEMSETYPGRTQVAKLPKSAAREADVPPDWAVGPEPQPFLFPELVGAPAPQERAPKRSLLADLLKEQAVSKALKGPKVRKASPAERRAKR